MSDSTASSPRRWLAPLALTASWGAAISAFVALLVARASIQDLPQQPSSLAASIVGLSAAGAGLFWLGVALFGNRLAAAIGVHGLALIGAVSALHFTVGASSRVAGQLLQGIIGPRAVFLSGIGDEGMPCLFVALLVVLRPKPGTVGVSLLTVFLLMVVTSGTIGLTSLLFVSTTVLLHEALLAAAGVTTGRLLQQPRLHAPTGVVVRTALAIGLANGAALFAQFAYYRFLYRLQFEPWYVFSVAGVNGVLYGTLGAALGTIWGYRLRRTAL